MITCDITKLSKNWSPKFFFNEIKFFKKLFIFFSKIKNENNKQTYFHWLILPNDHMNQMITFSLGITLSGFDCIAIKTYGNDDYK